MMIWHPCRLGHLPDPAWCPGCTPRWSERCFDKGWDGARTCRVQGTHSLTSHGDIIHADGRGMTWAYESITDDFKWAHAWGAPNPYES